MRRPKVLVAMSGGVDSSVAASLLVDQGYEVIGATMQVWDYSQCDIEEGHGTCCSSIDVDDARSVADRLGIPFYVLNCEDEFKISVIDPFISGYMQGKTPLPCVNCNTFLKFDHLIRKMKELNCDYLATGHYAQVIEKENGQKAILTSSDDWKDQTYFLFTIDPKILKHLLFPVGHLKKSEVRKIAEEKSLVVAKKKDSTGICFVGNQGYSNFIEKNVSSSKIEELRGVFKRYPSGEVIGNHIGIHHFTLGQSKGFGLSHHEKLFVIKIDAESKSVWLGEEKYLYSKKVKAIDPKLLGPLEDGETLEVKLRYSHKGAKAKVKSENGIIYFDFQDPQRAVTPGQAAVMYRGKELVGGAWIQE